MNACHNRSGDSVAGADRRPRIKALIRRVQCAIYIRQARRVLQSLDDDTLKDIGLTRFDAWRASNRALLFKLVRHRVDWSASRRNRVRNDVDLRRKSRAAFKRLRFGTLWAAAREGKHRVDVPFFIRSAHRAGEKP